MVLVLFALVAAVLVAAVLAVAGGRLTVDGLAPAASSTPDHGLPADPSAADVAGVRFATAARGYRMADVDERLEVLREELAARERAVDELRAGDA